MAERDLNKNSTKSNKNCFLGGGGCVYCPRIFAFCGGVWESNTLKVQEDPGTALSYRE